MVKYVLGTKIKIPTDDHVYCFIQLPFSSQNSKNRFTTTVEPLLEDTPHPSIMDTY